jgi:hypothetical protein
VSCTVSHNLVKSRIVHPATVWTHWDFHCATFVTLNCRSCGKFVLWYMVWEVKRGIHRPRCSGILNNLFVLHDIWTDLWRVASRRLVTWTLLVRVPFGLKPWAKSISSISSVQAPAIAKREREEKFDWTTREIKLSRAAKCEREENFDCPKQLNEREENFVRGYNLGTRLHEAKREREENW